MIGSCWRRSLNPKEYFMEVPARLLSTAIIQVRELLPAHGKLIRGTLLEGLVVGVKMKKTYTAKQGQHLAFIYYYTRIHGRAPTEAEMQQYFQVSPPSVHQMVLTLVARGLIERTPGQARSIRLLIPREELPDLA
jgi:repressor LexA